MMDAKNHCVIMPDANRSQAFKRVVGLIDKGDKEGATLALDGRGCTVEGYPNGNGTSIFTGSRGSKLGDLAPNGKQAIQFWTQTKTVTARWFEPDNLSDEVNTTILMK
jgi:acyl-CoA reductase-like NAD-dependent aldehyde dehydrogenase